MRRQKSNKITIEDRKNLHPKTNIKSTANRNLFYGIWIFFFNRENTKLIHFKIQYTFLPCMFCFPNSDHVMFSREFAFCLFINYAFICMWMHVHKTKFEKINSSVGYHQVVWNGKKNLQPKKLYCYRAKNELAKWGTNNSYQFARWRHFTTTTRSFRYCFLV